MNIERVLVYRLGSLGDFVVALPALRVVAAAFPRARRMLLTNIPVDPRAPSPREVLDGTELVDDYVEYPARLRDPREFLSLASRLRRSRPSIVVHLTGPRGRGRALRDAAFFAACGVRRQIGVPFRRDLAGYRWLADQDRFEHEAERLARCVAPLGEARVSDPTSWELCLSPMEREAATRILAAAGVDRPFLAFGVGTKFPTNDWGIDNWRRALARIGESRPNLALVAVGSAADAQPSNVAADAWPGVFANLSGRLTPRQSAAVLERAVAYAGHDSGPIHLAAAVQTRSVGIYGARNLPGTWSPYGPGHVVIRRDVACRGCELAVCTRYAKRCLTSITADEVAAAILERLPEQRLPAQAIRR